MSGSDREHVEPCGALAHPELLREVERQKGKDKGAHAVDHAREEEHVNGPRQLAVLSNELNSKDSVHGGQ